MKVGHQQVDVLKRKARRDEDACVAGGFPRLGPRLQRAHRRRADGHDTAATRLAVGNRLLCSRWHVVALGMHLVLGDDLGLDRLEGAGADMQRDMRALHATCFQFSQQGLVEMQRGRRRCNGAGHAGEHGLIAAFILGGILDGLGTGRSGVLLPFDVRRQRHMAAALHQRVRVFVGGTGKRETEQRPLRVGPAAQQGRTKTAGHPQRCADRRLLADLHVSDDFLAGQHALDQQFQLAAGRLFAEQARLDNLRVVEHQQIATLQQRRQAFEDAIDRRIGGAVEQSGGGAFDGRMLRDEFGRQGKIEIGKREGAHDA